MASQSVAARAQAQRRSIAGIIYDIAVWRGWPPIFGGGFVFAAGFTGARAVITPPLAQYEWELAGIAVLAVAWGCSLFLRAMDIVATDSDHPSQ
jgi:hypothetical protein